MAGIARLRLRRKRLKPPDFFIVGAPKSGTTALHRYLQRHPQLFLPQRKELPYLATDLTDQRPGMALPTDEYLEHFRRAEGKTAGASWALYLYSKNAAQELKQFSPNAKIIALLRNPVDMLHSYHSQLLAHGLEEIQDFQEALDAEEPRKNGERLPKWLPYPPECLYYSEIVQYAQQVERYFDAFGKENVRIVLFDDFVQDTGKIYNETVRFLGADPDRADSFEKVNPNSAARSAALQRRIIQPPRWAAKTFRALPKPVQKLGRAAQARLFHLNTRQTRREPLQPDARRRIAERLQPQIDLLENALRRNLDAWRADLQPQSGANGTPTKERR